MTRVIVAAAVPLEVEQWLLGHECTVTHLEHDLSMIALPTFDNEESAWTAIIEDGKYQWEHLIYFYDEGGDRAPQVVALDSSYIANESRLSLRSR